MIISNKLFTLQFPYRPDMSYPAGRPFGFYFMWRPREYPLKWRPSVIYNKETDDFELSKTEGKWIPDAPSRFAPIECAWSIGLLLSFWRPAKKAGPNTISDSYSGFLRHVWCPKFLWQFSRGKAA